MTHSAFPVEKLLRISKKFPIFFSKFLKVWNIDQKYGNFSGALIFYSFLWFFIIFLLYIHICIYFFLRSSSNFSGWYRLSTTRLCTVSIEHNRLGTDRLCTEITVHHVDWRRYPWIQLCTNQSYTASIVHDRLGTVQLHTDTTVHHSHWTQCP